MDFRSLMIKDLAEVGIIIDGIYDLVRTKEPYPEAIPVLIKYLKSAETDYKLKSGIVRALTVKEAKGIANDIILMEFNNTPKDIEGYRWTLGNAMDLLVQEKDLDTIIEIVKNKSNGTARQMFTLALGKIRSERSEEVLLQALNDEDIISHAIEALGRLKSLKSTQKLELLTNHSKPLVRKEATKALKKIYK